MSPERAGGLAAAILLLAAAAALAAGAAGPGRPGSDWPTFLGPGGENKSSERGIVTDWASAPPRLVWQRELGEGYSAPSVAGDRLFMFDRHGDRARLTALERATGRELWKSEYRMVYVDYYQYSGGPRASPVVDGGRVFTYGVEGRLRAHRVSDGELLWDVDTVADFGVVQNFFGVGSTPIVEGELLIVLVGGSPAGTPKIHTEKVVGNGTGVVAFDKKSGAVRWKLSDELASYSSFRIADIDGKRWGFVLARGGLLAFDPATGKQRFHFPWKAKILESVNAATPVVVDDTVFITETYGPGSALLTVKEPKPEVVWQDPRVRRRQSLATHWNTPIHVDGYLYGSHGRNSGDAQLRAVEHRTGKVVWSQPGLTRSTLLHVDDHLVVLTEYGRVLLVKVNPERYELVAETEFRDEKGTNLLQFPAWNAPVLAHGLLYLRGKDRLLCVELIPPAAGS